MDSDFDLEAMVSFAEKLTLRHALRCIQSILRKADFKPDAAGNYSLNDAESWEIIKLPKTSHRISIVQQTTL